MNPFIILLSVVISGAAILDSLVFTAPDIFIPEAGVVCDKPKAFCATQQGISKEKTLSYFSVERKNVNSQTAWDSLLHANQRDVIEFSDGAYCYLKEKHATQYLLVHGISKTAYLTELITCRNHFRVFFMHKE